MRIQRFQIRVHWTRICSLNGQGMGLTQPDESALSPLSSRGYGPPAPKTIVSGPPSASPRSARQRGAAVLGLLSTLVWKREKVFAGIAFDHPMPWTYADP